MSQLRRTRCALRRRAFQPDIPSKSTTGVISRLSTTSTTITGISTTVSTMRMPTTKIAAEGEQQRHGTTQGAAVGAQRPDRPALVDRAGGEHGRRLTEGQGHR